MSIVTVRIAPVERWCTTGKQGPAELAGMEVEIETASMGRDNTIAEREWHVVGGPALEVMKKIRPWLREVLVLRAHAGDGLMTTPEERHREGLYWALFAEFGEIAHALGGWHSIQGILLSDKLKVVAERLRVAGVQKEAIVRRAKAAGVEGRT